MHLTGSVAELGVWMGCSIIEEVVDAEGDVFPGAGRYGRRDGTDGCLHRVVDGSCIVIEYAGEFFAVFGLCSSELAGGEWSGQLLLVTIDGCSIGMRGMLGSLRMRMLESRKSLCNIFWHIEIDGLIWIVPIEVYATENFAITVDCYIVVFLEAVDEVIGVG